MNSEVRICPKCGHKRELESEIPEYECPACGIIYEKYLKANVPKQDSMNESKKESKAPSSLISCKICGKLISKNAVACPGCGEPAQVQKRAKKRRKKTIYAGFWKRVAAFIVDGAIIFLGRLAIGLLIIYPAHVLTGGSDMVLSIGKALGVLIFWVYYAVMEGSFTQGTLGKMAVGIKVTDLEGNKIDYVTAMIRQFGKIISMLFLLIGFIMVAFTKKKQGLHDQMTGCLVMNKKNCCVAVLDGCCQMP